VPAILPVARGRSPTPGGARCLKGGFRLVSEASILEQHILVLNRSWRAVTTTTVRRAMSLVYRDSARIIEPDTFEVFDLDAWAEVGQSMGEPVIRTVFRSFRVPEVILLRTYDGNPRRRVPFSRRHLLRRDESTCQYCGQRRGSEDLTIDHVVPRSLGGVSSWTNCVVACRGCNRRKGDGPPERAGMRLLRRPTKPRWHPSLAFSLGRTRSSWRRFIDHGGHSWNTTKS